MEGKKCGDNLSNLNQNNNSIEIRNSESKDKEAYVDKNEFTENFYKNENQYKNKKVYKNNKNPVEKIDAYTVQYMIYKAEIYILMRYPYLAEITKKNEDLSKKIDNNSKFFVIKSYSEEDVHKAIKYNVWTSTNRGNKILNESFKSTSEKGGSVYLIFSCNGSGRFLGIAKMKNEVEFDKYFPLWTNDNKWGGLFEIEWVFIKDVPFYKFKEIMIEMNDGITRSVSFSRDSQEIPFEEGKQIMEIYEIFSSTNTILEHFEYYDIRQDNYEKMFPLQQI